MEVLFNVRGLCGLGKMCIGIPFFCLSVCCPFAKGKLEQCYVDELCRGAITMLGGKWENMLFFINMMCFEIDVVLGVV